MPRPRPANVISWRLHLCLCEMKLSSPNQSPCLQGKVDKIAEALLRHQFQRLVFLRFPCLILSDIHILQPFLAAISPLDPQPAPSLGCHGNFMHASGTFTQRRWNCKVTCRHSLFSDAYPALVPTSPVRIQSCSSLLIFCLDLFFF